MKRIIFLMLALASLSSARAQGVTIDSSDGNNDLNLWIAAGVTKKLARQWSVDLGGELRLADNVSSVGRFSLGAMVNYKPVNLLRLSAGYEFIDSHSAAKNKADYNSEGGWNGLNYKQTDAFWRPRHRIKAEVSAEAPKLWKCIRISGRVRYQFTYSGALSVPRQSFKFYSSDQAPEDAYDELDDEGRIIHHDAVPGHFRGDLKPGYPVSDPKEYAVTKDHCLRSRIKVAYERKRCAWSPYVGFEFFNDLGSSMTLDKTRLSVGCDYQLTKHHELGLAYLLTTEYDGAAKSRIHAINLGYNYKF
ncbi:MAG: DUF2490 domain-containing protein [Bacteroidaceae bacterium]|nr:DUF2490 domain-containing protein [Bacteroidaceae bacterium]